jgi:hypothetical protein
MWHDNFIARQVLLQNVHAEEIVEGWYKSSCCCGCQKQLPVQSTQLRANGSRDYGQNSNENTVRTEKNGSV